MASALPSHMNKTLYLRALEKLVGDGTEDERGAVLEAAALMIQSAVLARQSPAEVTEVLNSIPQRLDEVCDIVIDRAVSCARQLDGSQLVLGLVPVIMNLTDSMPPVLPLTSSGTDEMKLAAYLQAQTGLAQGGWIRVLPALYHASQVELADLGELIRLPQQMREVIRGNRAAIEGFSGDDSVAMLLPGNQLFFLPYVAYYPADTVIQLPLPAERVAHRLAKWIKATFNQLDLMAPNLQVIPQPHPFSAAITFGYRALLETTLENNVLAVCEAKCVLPNALTAMVATYVAAGEVVLGASFVSRLTNEVVATCTIDLSVTDSAWEDSVAVAVLTLRKLGITNVQGATTPIETCLCMHCGNMQYELPDMSQVTLPATTRLQ